MTAPPTPFHLPTSTREMLAWLNAFHPNRLKDVMSKRSEAEKAAAREFILEERAKRKQEAAE